MAFPDNHRPVLKSEPPPALKEEFLAYQREAAAVAAGQHCMNREVRLGAGEMRLGTAGGDQQPLALHYSGKWRDAAGTRKFSSTSPKFSTSTHQSALATAHTQRRSRGTTGTAASPWFTSGSPPPTATTVEP